MADGSSNADIAAALTITEAAVGKHIGNVFLELGSGRCSRTVGSKPYWPISRPLSADGRRWLGGLGQ